MINLIVSVGLNGVIGCDGKLAHPIPEDLKRFKKITSGCAVVMGRKTFDNDLKSKPLSNRQNFILTKSKIQDSSDNVVFVNNFSEIKTDLPIWIIGGSHIYHLLLPKVDKMFVTHIHKPFIGTSYFQPNWCEWGLESSENKDYFSYATYTRK